MKRTAALILPCLSALLVLISVVPESNAQIWKADPGDADSLWILPVDWRGDTLMTLDVWAATDDSLTTAQVALTWPNPALRLDSAKLTVGRWNGGGYFRWTTAGTPNGVSLLFLPSTKRLVPGSGVVAKLFFGRDSAYTFDADIAIDTGQIAPVPPLAPYQTVFSEGANEIGPVYFSPCICTRHGDMVDDGDANALDLGYMIDALFAGGPLPLTDPDCPHQHRGDMNCDNNYDALDLGQLIDYLFAGGEGPCDPCEDL
jgi:hypothetical protein